MCDQKASSRRKVELTEFNIYSTGLAYTWFILGLHDWCCKKSLFEVSSNQSRREVGWSVNPSIYILIQSCQLHSHLNLFLHSFLSFIAPGNSIRCPHKIDGQSTLVSSCVEVFLENVVYLFVLTSPEVPSISCSSDLDGLWGEKHV